VVFSPLPILTSYVFDDTHSRMTQ